MAERAATGRRRWRRLARLLYRAAAWFVALSIGIVALYRYVPPPITPLMVIRLIEGQGLHKDWVAYDAVSPHVFKAVIAAEDARFCQHWGIDLDALRAAWRDNQNGKRLRGGSTITMQTAKNLFLWPRQSYVRKIFEAWFTLLLEALLNKRRILELYVNIAEFGPGVYGVEAASQAFFNKPAAALSEREAARLAAVLPNPREYSAATPGPYVREQAARYVARMRDLPPSGDDDCPVGRYADE